MQLNQIKAAVDAGEYVAWKSPAYRVIKDNIGQYLIAYDHGSSRANYIGLTWRDGVTLNGQEDEFFVVMEDD